MKSHVHVQAVVHDGSYLEVFILFHLSVFNIVAVEHLHIYYITFFAALHVFHNYPLHSVIAKHALPALQHRSILPLSYVFHILEHDLNVAIDGDVKAAKALLHNNTLVLGLQHFN